MMKKVSCVFLLCASAFCLNACTTTLEPRYQPHINQQLPAASQAFAIQVEDTRPVDPNMMGTVRGVNYVGSAGMPVEYAHDFKLAQPVADYVKTGLTSALQLAGYTIQDSSKNILLVRILDSQLGLKDVSMFTTQVNFTMQTQLIFTQAGSTDAAWKTTLNTKGVADLGFSRETAYDGALNNELDDLAGQIIQNSQFNSLVKK